MSHASYFLVRLPFVLSHRRRLQSWWYLAGHGEGRGVEMLDYVDLPANKDGAKMVAGRVDT